MKSELSEKWIKAAIAGTIWAASEIVLGSFLHNLRVPFSGNILTAIGLIILISINYTWSERGLFWRAGLICAIMKTLSPSAIIFGPMIAIMAESLLLELSVRLLGKTFVGYIIGAMLAMSWNLFHKIASYIISYGSNIVEVYTSLLNMAERQLNIKTDLVWLPIIILLIIYAMFGFLAAVIGIRVGRKLLKQPAVIPSRQKSTKPGEQVTGSEKKFNYSIAWLLLDISLIVGAFLLLSYTSWIIWSTAVTVVIILWAFRYKNSLRRISKPKFWILFVFITLITTFVFSKVQPGENSVMNGLLTGIQMNFRAALIVVGFSVTGTELYNPKIRDFFSRTMFKHLPLALELSVESLPGFIASIPDFKNLVRNPVSIFYQVISHADVRLNEVMNKEKFIQKIFIISGSRDKGKTAFTEKTVDELKRKNFPVGGILSMKIMEDTQIIGYDIVDIETNDTEMFLRVNEEIWKEKIGRFHINPKGLEMGKTILNPARLNDKKLVVIDEVGMFELDNRGWAGCLQELIEASKNHILITVRDTLIKDVIKKWNMKNVVLFKVSETDPVTLSKSILEYTGS
jgi:nucleoside-triphosphatase THEP1